MSNLPLTNLPPSIPKSEAIWPWTEEADTSSAQVSARNHLPRITVVTPSYNQGPYIEETIRSVLLQQYPNLEYIIIDGGSTDDTYRVIKHYAPWLSYWVSERDRGQSHAINKGFKQSTGEIIAWLNSDDLYCPGTLWAIARFFSEQPTTMVISGGCLLVDKERKAIGYKRASCLEPTNFLKGGAVPGQPAIFFRREVLDKAGLLNEDLHYVLDWEYWIRIGMHFSTETIYKTDHPLAEARIWEEAKTSIAGGKGIDERQFILDLLYQNKTLPPAILRLRAIAYSNMYWRRTLWRLQSMQYAAALNSLLRSVWLNPNPIITYARLYRLAEEFNKVI